MAEHRETSEAEAEGGLGESSPAAVAIALGRTGKSRGVDAKAEAFLEKQTRLVDLQTEHLHEQRELQISRLRLGRWKDRISLALQLMTAAAGLVVVAVVAAMAWSAHEDHGLVVEAFSTPPDLAAKGLSGQVIATRLLDRLRELQADTITGRPAESYANDWGGEIKVDIPETGVSVGELNRWLRQWLGRETRITGEVWRTPAGLAVTARAGEAPGKTFEGADTDLKSLIQQAAEAVYAQTQPYRYAVYLQTHGRPDDALVAFARLATSGPPEDRPWADAAWASVLLQQGDLEGAAVHAEAAQRQGVMNAYGALIQSYGGLSHEEAWLAAARRQSRYAREGRVNPDFPPGADLHATAAAIAQLLGDFQTAQAEFGKFVRLAPFTINLEGQARTVRPATSQAEDLARDHDVSAARRLLALVTGPSESLVSNVETARITIERADENWAGAASLLEAFLDRRRQQGEASRQSLHRRDWSNLALAYAHMGRQAEADGMIAQTPLDCDDCLRARGEIAAIEHDWAGVDRWYATAARHAPSTPFAYGGWGEALLAKGDVDGAIAKLSLAHQRGPHFADPLELWGEALMKKGDFSGAVRKFAEADKYAPRWGRNHLRWGEALARLGKADEAKAQFQATSGMDLSVADRAGLTRMQGAARR